MKPLGLSRFLLLAAILSLLAAIGQTLAVFDFLNHSYLVEATVIKGEVYRGPPRLPGSDPLHVKFQSLDGKSKTAETRSPFLRKFKAGDTVPILVQYDDATYVRLPYWTELWNLPLAFLFVSIMLTVLSRVVAGVGSRASASM